MRLSRALAAVLITLVAGVGYVGAATLSGGNGIYTVFVNDAGSGSCGAWTAQTAGLHPGGAGLNVIFRGGNPGTSDTTLRSYDTASFYRTGAIGGTIDLCGLAAPVITPIMNAAVTVGYRFDWTFNDGGNNVVLTQELEVVGPVDGTEILDNSAIRETHIVTNNGPGTFSFGLRKHWDWDISGAGSSDDGPHFGDCETPTDGCDRSMNLTAGAAPLYPQSYIMNEDPLNAACPAPVVPGFAGCTGNPSYIVAGTVAPPSTLVPPPDAPELLQFNRWSSLNGSTWQPALSDNTSCGGGDNAIAYFYGLTAATAESVAPGSSASFTEYVVAGGDACPDIVVGDCEPDPRSQGYWHRQCLGVSAADGGIDPGRNGRGPDSPTEPDFVPTLTDCAFAELENLGLFGVTTCEGMDADPANDPCEKAIKQTTALILNTCSDRLQAGCDIDLSEQGCASTNVGDLLDELAMLIANGDCVLAASCAAELNEGGGIANGGARSVAAGSTTQARDGLTTESVRGGARQGRLEAMDQRSSTCTTEVLESERWMAEAKTNLQILDDMNVSIERRFSILRTLTHESQGTLDAELAVRLQVIRAEALRSNKSGLAHQAQQLLRGITTSRR